MQPTSNGQSPKGGNNQEHECNNPCHRECERNQSKKKTSSPSRAPPALWVAKCEGFSRTQPHEENNWSTGRSDHQQHGDAPIRFFFSRNMNEEHQNRHISTYSPRSMGHSPNIQTGVSEIPFHIVWARPIRPSGTWEVAKTWRLHVRQRRTGGSPNESAMLVPRVSSSETSPNALCHGPICSRMTVSQTTIGHPLQPQVQPTWPFLLWRSAPDKCAPSSGELLPKAVLPLA